MKLNRQRPPATRVGSSDCFGLTLAEAEAHYYQQLARQVTAVAA